MNFITFPAAATNIFPAANSTGGGQLATEWNLRSREMVLTDPNITYQVGPSYVHGMKDFEVSILSDSGGAVINNHTLSIAEGRAIINGHYVETLVPMTIDLVEANATLAAQSREPLKGDLVIGIRSFYSTDQTVAGSILVEDNNDMFLGVQLVILPEIEFITPSDSPLDKSKVTGDVRLARFTFLNNTISSLKNLSSKIQFIPSDRVTSIGDAVSSLYVTKIGLNPKKIYSFAGKGTDPSTGADTWEDVTDSTMVWDAEPTRTSQQVSYRQAQIVTAADGAYFVIPHKQVIGMTDDQGNYEYYAPRIIEFPVADYTTNSVGVVNSVYTKQIKAIATQVSQFRTTLTGKQIYFMDVRSIDDTELPVINDAWQNGDYILVRHDDFYLGSASDIASSPATQYVVLPGQVINVHFVAQVNGDAHNDAGIPSNISGIELGYQEWYEASGRERPETTYPDHYPEFFGDNDVVRGVPGNINIDQWVDYFRIRYYVENSADYAYTDYFYAVLTAGPREWSDAVIVTGQVEFATEEIIGGFLNTSEEATDYGYVRLDDTGHLRLVDYQLLRSGTLAYQIGSDITIPSSASYEEIQKYLTEYVNDRVAFPTTAVHGAYPPILNIYLTLPESNEDVTLEIGGIDSRFNTAVCLHIQGSARTNTTINISDCEKFMIDSSIEGHPVINVFRTKLFYDPIVMQYIKTCSRDTSIYGNFTGFRDLSLWYEQRNTDDPALLVDGMTVSELDAQIISTDINYWRELGAAINDNNYLVALKSITFSGNGDIVGCEVLTANNSTDNIVQGNKIIVGNFILPQGSSLVYPIACLTRKLKVTGEFTSAYYSDSSWYVTDNSFSLETGTYDPNDPTTSMTGTVAFHSVTTIVPSTISQTSISVWESDAYHVFRGGAIS